MFKKRNTIGTLLLPTFGSFILALLLLPTLSSRLTPASAGSTFTLFLPIVGRNFPVRGVFGAELTQLTSSGGLDQLSAAKGSWARRNAVLWSDVEPSPGLRNWSASSIASLDQELINAASQSVSTILIVRSTPAWAQKVPGYLCGPVAQASMGAFGNFMRDLVARYSVAPFNVKYWEIWNEPDLDPSIAPAGDSAYGCWGDQTDPYYGGRYYATMLKTVYPQIKAADPQSQVLIGGLLIDCDPRGPCTTGGWDPLRSKFLQGILVGGGGPYFDGVSYHAYDVYLGKLGQYGLGHWGSAWNTTGPVVLAKTSYVKSVLAQYGVTKFLMNTESGLLLCAFCTDDADFEASKAYYVPQLYAASIAQGLKADIWYSMYGWQNSGLLASNGTPLPAYNAFKFAASELQGILSSTDLGYTSIKGYEMDRGDARIWVLWSLDGNAHQISLPGIPSAAYFMDGTAMTPSASLTVTLEPVYLEWR